MDYSDDNQTHIPSINASSLLSNQHRLQWDPNTRRKQSFSNNNSNKNINRGNTSYNNYIPPELFSVLDINKNHVIDDVKAYNIDHTVIGLPRHQIQDCLQQIPQLHQLNAHVYSSNSVTTHYTTLPNSKKSIKTTLTTPLTPKVKCPSPTTKTSDFTPLPSSSSQQYHDDDILSTSSISATQNSIKLPLTIDMNNIITTSSSNDHNHDNNMNNNKNNSSSMHRRQAVTTVPIFDVTIDRRVSTNTAANPPVFLSKPSSDDHHHHHQSINSSPAMKAIQKPGLHKKTHQNIVAFEKQLSQISRNFPGADTYFNNILPIYIENRNMNLSEKNMFLLADRLENSGDYTRAIDLYSKTSINSKEPYLGKLCIANVYFKIKKYLLAIQFYTHSIKFREGMLREDSNKIHDLFCAYYNRSINFFKIGDDKNGLIDMKRALYLKPMDINALEVYALCLRRLQMYDEVVGPVSKLKLLRPSTTSSNSSSNSESNNNNNSVNQMSSRRNSNSNITSTTMSAKNNTNSNSSKNHNLRPSTAPPLTSSSSSSSSRASTKFLNGINANKNKSSRQLFDPNVNADLLMENTTIITPNNKIFSTTLSRSNSIKHTTPGVLNRGKSSSSMSNMMTGVLKHTTHQSLEDSSDNAFTTIDIMTVNDDVLSVDPPNDDDVHGLSDHNDNHDTVTNDIPTSSSSPPPSSSSSSVTLSPSLTRDSSTCATLPTIHNAAATTVAANSTTSSATAAADSTIITSSKKASSSVSVGVGLRVAAAAVKFLRPHRTFQGSGKGSGATSFPTKRSSSLSSLYRNSRPSANNNYNDDDDDEEEEDKLEVIEISDPTLNNPSLFHTTQQSIQSTKLENHQSHIHLNQYTVSSLKQFKIQHGYHHSLLQHLFEVPSALQNALIIHPKYRQNADLIEIQTYLKLIPSFRVLDDSDVMKLAQIVEYRVVGSETVLYHQHLTGGDAGRVSDDSNNNNSSRSSGGSNTNNSNSNHSNSSNNHIDNNNSNYSNIDHSNNNNNHNLATVDYMVIIMSGTIQRSFKGGRYNSSCSNSKSNSNSDKNRSSNSNSKNNSSNSININSSSINSNTSNTNNSSSVQPIGDEASEENDSDLLEQETDVDRYEALDVIGHVDALFHYMHSSAVRSNTNSDNRSNNSYNSSNNDNNSSYSKNDNSGSNSNSNNSNNHNTSSNFNSSSNSNTKYNTTTSATDEQSSSQSLLECILQAATSRSVLNRSSCNSSSSCSNSYNNSSINNSGTTTSRSSNSISNNVSSAHSSVTGINMSEYWLQPVAQCIYKSRTLCELLLIPVGVLSPNIYTSTSNNTVNINRSSNNNNGSSTNNSNNNNSHINNTTTATTTTTTITNAAATLYKQLLYPIYLSQFQHHLHTVTASGVFSNWPVRSVIELTRLGRQIQIKNNSIIYRQGETVSFLYIVLKGVCTAYRHANEIRVLQKRLIELRRRADKHDCTYIFHHDMGRKTVYIDISQNRNNNNNNSSSKNGISNKNNNDSRSNSYNNHFSSKSISRASMTGATSGKQYISGYNKNYNNNTTSNNSNNNSSSSSSKNNNNNNSTSSSISGKNNMTIKNMSSKSISLITTINNYPTTTATALSPPLPILIPTKTKHTKVTLAEKQRRALQVEIIDLERKIQYLSLKWNDDNHHDPPPHHHHHHHLDSHHLDSYHQSYTTQKQHEEEEDEEKYNMNHNIDIISTISVNDNHNTSSSGNNNNNTSSSDNNNNNNNSSNNKNSFTSQSNHPNNSNHPSTTATAVSAVIDKDDIEIGTFRWPMLFGEDCLLFSTISSGNTSRSTSNTTNTTNNISEKIISTSNNNTSSSSSDCNLYSYTVTALTDCEVLIFHTSQLKQFQHLFSGDKNSSSSSENITGSSINDRYDNTTTATANTTNNIHNTVNMTHHSHNQYSIQNDEEENQKIFLHTIAVQTPDDKYLHEKTVAIQDWNQYKTAFQKNLLPLYRKNKAGRDKEKPNFSF